MTAKPSRWLRTTALVAGIVVPALALAGCGSGRDRELSERLVAAQVAAQRAEAASLIAQKAAARASAPGIPQVAVADEAAEPVDPAEDENAAEKDPADENAEATTFDNNVVSLPAPPPPQPMPPAA